MHRMRQLKKNNTMIKICLLRLLIGQIKLLDLPLSSSGDQLDKSY